MTLLNPRLNNKTLRILLCGGYIKRLFYCNLVDE